MEVDNGVMEEIKSIKERIGKIVLELEEISLDLSELISYVNGNEKGKRFKEELEKINEDIFSLIKNSKKLEKKISRLESDYG